jgi:hypothetical protein
MIWTMDDPVYAKDLAEFKTKQTDLKCNCFDRCTDFLRMSPEHLVHTGHKTIEAGMVWTVKSYQKDIDKLLTNFLKKYPD